MRKCSRPYPEAAGWSAKGGRGIGQESFGEKERRFTGLWLHQPGISAFRSEEDPWTYDGIAFLRNGGTDKRETVLFLTVRGGCGNSPRGKFELRWSRLSWVGKHVA